MTPEEVASYVPARYDSELEIPNDWEPWFDEFLVHLSQLRVITHAAAASGRSRRSVHYARKRVPEFDFLVEEVISSCIGELEATAWQRGIDGYREPVFHQGKVVGAKQRYETSLTLALLQAYIPEKFRKEVAQDVAVNVSIESLIHKIEMGDEKNIIDVKDSNAAPAITHNDDGADKIARMLYCEDAEDDEQDSNHGEDL